MKEILEFIFTDGYTYFGTLLLVSVILFGVSKICSNFKK